MAVDEAAEFFVFSLCHPAPLALMALPAPSLGELAGHLGADGAHDVPGALAVVRPDRGDHPDALSFCEAHRSLLRQLAGAFEAFAQHFRGEIAGHTDTECKPDPDGSWRVVHHERFFSLDFAFVEAYMGELFRSTPQVVYDVPDDARDALASQMPYFFGDMPAPLQTKLRGAVDFVFWHHGELFDMLS